MVELKNNLIRTVQISNVVRSNVLQIMQICASILTRECVVCNISNLYCHVMAVNIYPHSEQLKLHRVWAVGSLVGFDIN